MISSMTGPIFKRANGSYEVNTPSGRYGVSAMNRDAANYYLTVPEVESYLLDHPEALISEPVPPPPTEEELARQRISEARAYLASTDWIIAKIGEAQMLGKPIDGLLEKYAGEMGKRVEARETINRGE